MNTDTQHTVLVTGGAGYVGSHALVALIEAGYAPVVIDNLCNSRREAIERVQTITGQAVPLICADVQDRTALRDLFTRYPVQAVLHFAGLKSVADSVAQPLRYYRENVGVAVALLEEMLHAGCLRLVFSSSATVYGSPQQLPYTEEHPLRPLNPYGQAKAMVEQIIADVGVAQPAFRALNLRYFNPVGAHESGLIGEDPLATPANLMPFVCQVAVRRRACLQIFGTDWPTRDGTGVRDYLHVMDLAEAHVAALQALEGRGGVRAVNIGTGVGYSVKEVVAAFEQAAQRAIPTQLAPRRDGDLAEYYADASRAADLLGWRARRGLEQMCADAWRWQQAHPNGYAQSADACAQGSLA